MKALFRMARYMRPYRLEVIFGLLTVILPVAMELLMPRLLQYIVDEGIRLRDMDAIWRGSMIMLATAVVGAAATLVQGLCRARLSQGMAFDMRNDLFRHVGSLSFADIDRLQTGQLMTRVGSDVNVVRMFSSAGLALLLRALLMIIGSVIMIILTDLQLAFIVLGFVALAGLMIWWFMGRAAPLFTVVQEKLALLNTLVQENLAGVQVVKAFVRERFATDRFADYNDEYMAQNIRVGRLLALVMPVLTLLTNAGTVAVIWMGGLDVIDNRLTSGELIAFVNYLMIGMAPLLLLSNMLMMVSRASASATRIEEVLQTEPRIRTVATPHQPQRLEGRVRFEGVSFRYSGANGANGHLNGDDPAAHEVLHQVSFQAEPGQRIALLGATGSGKSTLIHLIPRFYDTTSGSVQIDGVDVRRWSPRALRKRIGVVLQETILFSGTVCENIAYGRPDASLEEVIAAAKTAQAHDFIMAMPQGYESTVEARGANLSGGQKQRIAIARALLTQPGILILDDSTSAVDVETEAKIQEVLDQLMAGTTTFIVAQRISSVLNADQILVLDHGHIVAQGRHRELLASSPIYQEIYHSQLGAEQTGVSQ
jgi:ATP-binding cassette, subfamily B, multidrug efflux pump